PGGRQLGAEEFGSIFLDEDLGLEVEPRGQAEELVPGAGVAVRTSMLASPIRVERELEWNVPAVVGRPDRLRVVAEEARSRGRVAVLGPARNRLAIERDEPVWWVVGGPAAADGLRRGHMNTISGRLQFRHL